MKEKLHIVRAKKEQRTHLSLSVGEKAGSSSRTNAPLSIGNLLTGGAAANIFAAPNLISISFLYNVQQQHIKKEEKIKIATHSRGQGQVVNLQLEMYKECLGTRPNK